MAAVKPTAQAVRHGRKETRPGDIVPGAQQGALHAASMPHDAGHAAGPSQIAEKSGVAPRECAQARQQRVRGGVRALTSEGADATGDMREDAAIGVGGDPPSSTTAALPGRQLHSSRRRGPRNRVHKTHPSTTRDTRRGGSKGQQRTGGSAQLGRGHGVHKSRRR